LQQKDHPRTPPGNPHEDPKGGAGVTFWGR